MPAPAHELLRRLEPAVRPLGDGPIAGRVPIDEADFLALFDLARRGAMASDRAVDTAGLVTALDREALSRLGRALDLLEAGGVRRAVVLYGGRALLADVASRRFEREIAAQESPEPVAVDAVLRVAMPDESASNRPPGPPQPVPEAIGTYRLLAARDSLISP